MNFKLGRLPHITAPPKLQEEGIEEGRKEGRKEGSAKGREFFQKLVLAEEEEEEVCTNSCCLTACHASFHSPFISIRSASNAAR